MVKVIAEIGSNFEPGNLDSARHMIALAAECGADVAKFQILDTDNINRPQWWKDKCKPWNIPDGWYNELANEALRHKIDLLFSVFTPRKASLYALKCRHIKIASSEIGNQDLMRSINCVVGIVDEKTHIQDLTRVYMSVPPDKHGMLIPALTWLNNCRVTLMHCVPEYPAKDPQLDAIPALLELGLPVGWSSHVAYPDAVCIARQAVDLGAVVVEAHLRDRDTLAECPDNGLWALCPKQFEKLVGEVKK